MLLAEGNISSNAMQFNGMNIGKYNLFVITLAYCSANKTTNTIAILIMVRDFFMHSSHMQIPYSDKFLRSKIFMDLALNTKMIPSIFFNSLGVAPPCPLIFQDYAN